LKIQKKLFLGPFTSAPQYRQMNCFSQLNSIDRVPHAAAEEADSKNSPSSATQPLQQQPSATRQQAA
jgi:hypothetical protein